MAIKQITKEVGEVLTVNASVLGITTFADFELVLKILLLVVTICYTIDKWWYHKKNR